MLTKKLITRKNYNIRELYDLLRQSENLKQNQIELKNNCIFVHGSKGMGIKVTIKNGNTIATVLDWSSTARQQVILLTCLVVTAIIPVIWSSIASSENKVLELKLHQEFLDMNL